MTRLSGPQLIALRYARNRQLFASDINRGAAQRTYATLFKRGMLDWHEVYHDRVVLTAAGERALAEAKPDLPTDVPDNAIILVGSTVRINAKGKAKKLVDEGELSVVDIAGVHPKFRATCVRANGRGSAWTIPLDCLELVR